MKEMWNEKQIIEKYLCPGCFYGSDTECFKNSGKGREIMCSNHCAETIIHPGGKILLGMPNGFNRYGSNDINITIFMSYEDLPSYPFNYEKFNIPVWKHFDGECTLVRGLSPRINKPFINIFYGDVRDKINCLEITKEDIENMD